jgi:hypothetical protein
MDSPRERPGKARRHAIVSFVLAWSIFSLCYTAGFGLLLLGSLAMHGPKPWSYLTQAGVIGTLLGGSVGLLRPWKANRLAEGRAGPNRWAARIGLILWSVVGLLLSLFLDFEGLAGRHDYALLLAPAVMLAVAVAGFLLQRSVVDRPLDT